MGQGMLNAPTRRSEPLRSMVGGTSEPSPGLFLTQQSCDWLTAGASEGLSEPSSEFAGWDRLVIKALYKQIHIKL